MAKAKIIIFSVIGALLAAVLTFGIVMGFLSTPAMPKLDSPSSLKIILTGGYSETNNASTIELDKNADETKDDYNKLWAEINKATSFSQLSAVLENEWFRSYQIATQKDSEGKKEFKKLDAFEIRENIRGNLMNGEYLLVFRYLDGNKRSVKISGEDISYDTVFMIIKDSGINITPFKMYFIDYYKVFEQSSDIIDDETAEDYYAYEVIAWGRQSNIFNTIEDILEENYK